MKILILNNDIIMQQAAIGLRENGHDVFLPEKPDDYRLSTDRLGLLLDQIQPDFCLMRNRRVMDRGFNPHGEDIEEFLCANGIPHVSWFTENPLASGSLDSVSYFQLRGSHRCYNLTISPETARVIGAMGHQAAYLPLAATPEWFRASQEDQEAHSYQVSFIGRPKVALPPACSNQAIYRLVSQSLRIRQERTLVHFGTEILPRLTEHALISLERHPSVELEAFDEIARGFSRRVHLLLGASLEMHLMIEAARLAMVRTIGWLLEAGVPLKLFGGKEWAQIFPGQGETPLVPFQEQATIYRRSRVNLVLSKIELRDVAHERIFNIAACGGFVLAEHRDAVLGLFPNGEVPTFRNREELIDKVNHYLASEEERRALSLAARERVTREHTFARRMEEMVKLVRGFLSGVQSQQAGSHPATQEVSA